MACDASANEALGSMVMTGVLIRSPTVRAAVRGRWGTVITVPVWVSSFMAPTLTDSHTLINLE